MRSLAVYCLVVSFFFTGCMGPVALHKAVLGYDESVSRIEREMLLLNIARKHQHLPSHFTVTSSIAATFDYRTNLGFDAALFGGGVPANEYGPSVGVSAAENPTLSIVPIQGEEFTRRVLSPMGESKFLFVVYQGTPVDMVMRMMARGIEMQNPDGTFQRFLLNWPSRPDEYEEFRRRALHLTWLNANRQLFVSRLHFEQTLASGLGTSPSAKDVLSAVEKGYRWRFVEETGTYDLTKQIAGRVAITNYDPRALSNRERETLNEKASKNPKIFVFVDIRPGHPGGDFPFRGAIKLRSFNEILEFLAAGIEKNPEFDVGADPRTGTVLRNPRETLDVGVANGSPPRPFLGVRFKGHDYFVLDTPWDREAFTLLYNLYQMTVTDVSGVGVPIITISK